MLLHMAVKEQQSWMLVQKWRGAGDWPWQQGGLGGKGEDSRVASLPKAQSNSTWARQAETLWWQWPGSAESPDHQTSPWRWGKCKVKQAWLCQSAIDRTISKLSLSPNGQTPGKGDALRGHNTDKAHEKLLLAYQKNHIPKYLLYFWLGQVERKKRHNFIIDLLLNSEFK